MIILSDLLFQIFASGKQAAISGTTQHE